MATDEEIEESKAVVAPVTTKPAQPVMKPSLLIKNIIRNVKIYFDYNKAELRDDHLKILGAAVKTLQKNPDSSILITGNCDARGSDEYNMKLGKARGEAVQAFMRDNGILEDRIKIISKGKLDAVAPISDLEGMQRDRNAQFMIAEVEEIMLPGGSVPTEPDAKIVEEGKFVVEKDESVESETRVSTREYVIQKNDSLWKIAEREMGNGNRWKYLYELNKDRISNPDKLKEGKTIIIPIE
jgi:outer membrane protein OmpA-like peptidoglycan-associated protein